MYKESEQFIHNTQVSHSYRVTSISYPFRTSNASQSKVSFEGTFGSNGGNCL